MLIRDPGKRSTLEDIARDPWLSEGSIGEPEAEVLPLVSRQHLTEEDHAHIIHKMVSGNIASMEEILELVLALWKSVECTIKLENTLQLPHKQVIYVMHTCKNSFPNDGP